MKLEGSDRLDLPVADAWARLSDPASLGESLPAVEEVEVEGNGFRARFNPVTGLGATPMTVDFEVVVREEPVRLVVVGNGGASEYAVRLRAAIELSEADGGTRVDWALELRIHGIMRSLTQRVIGGLARQQVAAVLAGVEKAATSVG